jgi:hypothetical protein
MTPYEIVRQAIQNRQQVRATYGGHARDMAPHLLGTKKGVAHGLFYQFGGTSETGLAPPQSVRNWRRLPIEGLSELSVLGGEWHSAPLGRQHQRCVDTVDVWARVQGFTVPAALLKSVKRASTP